MTTLSQPLPRAFATAGKLVRRPPLVAFALTLLISLLLVSAAAAAYAHVHRDSIFPGVTVNGVAVGGLDRAEAEARLRASLPALDTGHLTVRFADVERRVTYAEIGRDYDMAAMLDEAFALGREGGPLQQAGQQLRLRTQGATVEPAVTWDAAALEQRLSEIAAAAEVAPLDAQVVARGDGYRVIPARYGQTVDFRGGLEQALAAVAPPSAASAVVAVAPTQIAPAVGTAVAQSVVDRFEQVVSQAFVASGGGVNQVVAPATVRGWVSIEEQGNGAWAVVIDRAAIAAYVAPYAALIDRDPQNARFEFGDDGVTAIAGVTGQTLDVAATVDLIEGLLQERLAGGSPSGVQMAVSYVEPEVTTAAARALAARVVKLSSWTTKFVPSEKNFFGKNISVPAKLLNGTVVGPGERFSFLDAVGSFTPEKGFGPGGAIIRGRTNPTGAMGGGICSASTTLFNAALRAGYEIEARTQHSYYISRYPVGLDATVWRSGGSKRDMVFVNDSEYPLWIRGINGRGKITFEIWSVPDGRTVDISDPRVAERSKPHEVVEYTTELRPGEQKRVEEPVAGFKSWVTRVVRDADGKLLHRDTFYSRYITINGITQIGIAPGETPPPTELTVPADG
ncbi:MAG: VanW family protein [Chloroflexota bacterium]|nr:VanW family protein [Chloroflexota bacterium]